MKIKPMIRLIDGFAGVGGCSMGYYLAAKELGVDIEITGVDINPQKNYPFKFIQADIFEYISKYGLDEFNLVHFSPPCQPYSVLKALTTKEYPMLIPVVREMLINSGKDYVIENVYGALDHMINPIMLCGTQFNLKVFRHRLFETNFPITEPEHKSHKELGDYTLCKQGRMPNEGDYMTLTGNFAGIKYARRAMGVEYNYDGSLWKLGTHEVSQMIPPDYTKYIMKEYIKWLGN